MKRGKSAVRLVANIFAEAAEGSGLDREEGTDMWAETPAKHATLVANQANWHVTAE